MKGNNNEIKTMKTIKCQHDLTQQQQFFDSWNVQMLKQENDSILVIFLLILFWLGFLFSFVIILFLKIAIRSPLLNLFTFVDAIDQFSFNVNCTENVFGQLSRVIDLLRTIWIVIEKVRYQ